jgi:hypothetical protein
VQITKVNGNSDTKLMTKGEVLKISSYHAFNEGLSLETLENSCRLDLMQSYKADSSRHMGSGHGGAGDGADTGCSKGH